METRLVMFSSVNISFLKETILRGAENRLRFHQASSFYKPFHLGKDK